ncbi:thiolase family protein [Spongiibacter sp. KMU-166]|uniref:Thiolase family protein n=1 Tax=Spongiibacter thalassae TaxID=2721624 RepID=A0ABX1GE74_9GAMM|nr:thiolase family protein [Spongiibacter thalassae]NKI16554.1 thiolase family protein [Spongiibacter thalassae]
MNHSSEYPEKNTAITGIGQSEISRGSAKTGMALTVDACMEAITHAGLTRADIDGIATWPGADYNTSGFSTVGIPQIQDALRLEVNWYCGAPEGPGQFAAVFDAIGAISAGLCKHVLVFRTLTEATARKTAFANALMTPGQRDHGLFQWYSPYHTYAAAVQQAMYFQAYVHKSGIREEQYAQIALNGRRNAGLNPKAVYRSPMTLDDYLASPMISTPLRMFDCDVPIDGSTAIIISRRDCAEDLPNKPINIEAIGSSMAYRNSWAQLDALETQAQPKVAEMMWSRTDLKPKDVDFAELYDGFSFHSINWLENFGFCERYGAGDFIDGGHNIALDGMLPINTNGGALSAGRMHAYGQIHEACLQLWGRAGDRQLAKPAHVAALSTAGGPLAGCMLLVAE